MSYLHRQSVSSSRPSEAPPPWSPAPEKSHQNGLWNEASQAHFKAAQIFCSRSPPEQPRLLHSSVVDDIRTRGDAAWALVPSSPFVGAMNQIRVRDRGQVTKVTTRNDQDDCCLLSNLPIVAGQYHIPLNGGVYYEITVEEMPNSNSIIAIGTACRPYPPFRLPGWNRLSAALHLDDFRKFFEDPRGGRDYTQRPIKVSPGDVVGCGYEFHTGVMFFTHQGRRLPNAFTGIYLLHKKYDVYAAVGITGATRFTVNFGGDAFRWLPGNEWSWRLDRHVGQLTERTSRDQEELPSYRT